MKLQRNRLVYAISRATTSMLIGVYHEVECTGAENIPEQGPALLLPKHHYQRDILLEGLFLARHCKRKGNWIMKSELPGVLKYVGGITISRPKNIRKIKDSEKRREAAEKAAKQNKKAMDYVKWLFEQGEIVVVHPEGKRVKNKMGRIKTGFINLAKRVQAEKGIEIPAIPIGIEYDSSWVTRSRAYLRAGKPQNVTRPDIASIIEQEIRKLSNL